MDHPTTTTSLENNITLTTFSLVFLSCTLISFIGVLPILIFKKFGKVDENTLKNSLLLRCLLNFSVGTLLFDAFCHIIPEAITISKDPNKILLRTIFGILMFFGIEKFAKLAEYEEDEEEEGQEEKLDVVEGLDEQNSNLHESDVFMNDVITINKIPETPKKQKLTHSGNFASRNFSFKEPLSDSNNNMINGDSETQQNNNNSTVRQRHNVRSKTNISSSKSTSSEIISSSSSKFLQSTNTNSSISRDSTSTTNSSAVSSSTTNLSEQKTTITKVNKHKKTAAKLNLLANIMDNFYHGLSVGTAFLISTKCGFLAAFSILLHEIPHEFGDFAIQLNGGKTIQEAAWDQWKTATASFLGGMVALFVCSCWQEVACNLLLPLSAGGFIYVALSTILADLVNENDIYKQHNSRNQIRLFLLEIACTLSGVGIMYWSMQLF